MLKILSIWVNWWLHLSSNQRELSLILLFYKSTANVLVGRGENEAYDFSQYVCKQQKQTERLLTCVQWVPDPVVYWTGKNYLYHCKKSVLADITRNMLITIFCLPFTLYYFQKYTILLFFASNNKLLVIK